jgi:hypothetical protein
VRTGWPGVAGDAEYKGLMGKGLRVLAIGGQMKGTVALPRHAASDTGLTRSRPPQTPGPLAQAAIFLLEEQHVASFGTQGCVIIAVPSETMTWGRAEPGS